MAGNTYVEKFNFYLHTFLGEINTILPEFSEIITSNYSDVLEDKTLKDDKYAKEFMTSIDKYRTEIAEKNDKLFKGEESVFLLNGVDFKELWCKDLSDSTRENIWKYLQTLILIGTTIRSKSSNSTNSEFSKFSKNDFRISKYLSLDN